MKQAELIQVAGTRYPSEMFGYPADVLVISHQNLTGSVHMIRHSDVNPATNFSTAPNGSIYISSTSGGVWVKSGDHGASDGTWSEVTAGVPTTATATSNGLTTGLLTARSQFVTVTSSNSDHICELPSIASVPVGTVIKGRVGANGFELRLSTADRTAATVLLNEVGGATEAAIAADTFFRVEKVSATQYILTALTKLGAVVSAIVPDSV